MASTAGSGRAERFFRAVTARPVWVLVLTILPVLASGAFLPRLTRDPSPEAYIPADHPAILYRDRVKEIFGLEDPMVLAIVAEGADGVFTPHTLELVAWLTDEVSRIPGVDPDRITSLATEKNIIGTEAGFIVEPFFEAPPGSREAALAVRDAVMDFELYVGSLVAADGTATLLVAELLDAKWEESVLADLHAVAARAPRGAAEVYVAGPGAVDASLANYIDSDQRRLNPVAFAIIITILALCYRTARAVLLPLVVVAASLAVAFGTMAAIGIPFYVITNSLTVILIAISVADAIHILGEYYEQIAASPDLSARELVVRSMVKMWRPVTFTSITTICGFLGLGLASYMPPMRYYGYFGSVGVAAALAFSLLTLPSLLVLLRPQRSPAFRPGAGGALRPDGFGRVVASLGAAAARRPTPILVGSALLVLLGGAGATQLMVQGSFVEVFDEEEDIRRADEAINARLDGTNHIDVVIETSEVEGLFDPERLRRIEALQAYAETLPNVKGSVSLVDYLKQMNRALHENRKDAYALPDDPDLVAQYFVLYSASGDPTDFEEIVDYDYRLANVRLSMDTGLYTRERDAIEAIEAYLDREVDGPGMRATVTGRAALHYHWTSNLARGHFRGVALALLGVWLAALFLFRSAVAGLLAVAPVMMAVLLTYAVMGFGEIWLNGGTSMIAAIAIGTGIDFALHIVDRLIALVRDEGREIRDALPLLFSSTGRALLFSFAAVALGFGVLSISRVPTLVNFGILVASAVTASFVFSLTVLPVLVATFRPRFLARARPDPMRLEGASSRA